MFRLKDSDVEAKRKISAWNRTHIVLHPKTCHVILKTIRTTFPDQIKPDVAFNKCLQKLNPDDRTLCTRILAELNDREFLGMTVYELKVSGLHFVTISLVVHMWLFLFICGYLYIYMWLLLFIYHSIICIHCKPPYS